MKKNILVTGHKGYIGTALTKYLKEHTYHIIHGTDINWYTCNFYNSFVDFQYPYDLNFLTTRYYGSMDYIIHLAGHSSVGMSRFDGSYLESPAYHNNVYNFSLLLEKLLNCVPSPKIIYASSASVYGSRETVNYEQDQLDDLLGFNPYDRSKREMEILAESYEKLPIVGLRFGTVCGVSPHIRNELVMNSMVYSALTEGVIHIAQPKLKRSILFMNDLCQRITEIIDSPNFIPSGVYNLLSWNSSIGGIATTIANSLDVDVETYQPEIESQYSFHMSQAKLSNTMKNMSPSSVSIETVIEQLVEAYKNNKTFLSNRNEPRDYSFK